MEEKIRELHLQYYNFFNRYSIQPNAIFIGETEFKKIMESDEVTHTVDGHWFAFNIKIHRTLDEQYLAVGFVEEAIRIK